MLLLLELLQLDVVSVEGHGRGMRLIRLGSCISRHCGRLRRHTETV